MDPQAGDGRPLGWRTRRLDVAMRDQGHSECLEFDSLVAIIQCLPNLATVSFSVATPKYAGPPMPARVLQALAETCGHSLRVVTWSRPALEPHSDDWWSFLAVASNLEIIHCPYAFRAMNPAICAILPVLPALTSLALASDYLDVYYDGDTINRFPQLQEIVYFIHSWNALTWEPFLQNYGHGLTTVVLHCRLKISLQIYLSQLTRFCPNLKRLDVVLGDWSNFVSGLVLPPVTHLGLRCRELQTTSQRYRLLFRSLAAMETLALKVVQLTDYRILSNLRNHNPKVFAEGIMALKSRNIYLQDVEGHVVEME